MPYIIEKIMLYENEQIKHCNLVVKNNVIYSRDISVRQMKFIRLNMDKHIIIATESVFGNLEQWRREGLEYAKKMVLIGATTIIFPVDVKSEWQLKATFQKAREELASFPLDYVLAIRIPFSSLNPKLIRLCRLLHIPICVVMMNGQENFRSIMWKEIREAVFPYKLVFIPQCNGQKLIEWNQFMNNEWLSFHDKSLIEATGINKSFLKKIGIYPHKGILRSGGDVTYNVLQESDKEYLMNEDLMYYDKIEYTVFKNNVIRVGKEVAFTKNAGEELVIKVPGFFL